MTSQELLRRFAVRATASAGYRLTRLSGRLSSAAVEREEASSGHTLAGDRDVEWAWSLGHLRAEPGRVLDFGAGHGLLALTAAFRGHRVTAVDLEPRSFMFEHSAIDYRRGDVNLLDLEHEAYDQVLNCSSVEHVGLEGRYGSADDPGGDLTAMTRLAAALRPGGEMVMTIPVGRDAVFAPYHRVYGEERLPLLLEQFEIVVEEYRAKLGSPIWETVAKVDALATEGSATYYALGLFVLRRR